VIALKEMANLPFCCFVDFRSCETTMTINNQLNDVTMTFDNTVTLMLEMSKKMDCSRRQNSKQQTAKGDV